jgi:isopentenyl phosphate kinase
MVVGFNHNVRYRGEVFHVQTEDSGLANPYILTLLYLGGTIISSKKTSYDDIIKMENLEHVIEELMKEQHKGMLLRLKAGEFDERAFPGKKFAAAETAPASPKAQGGTRNLDEVILDYLAADD